MGPALFTPLIALSQFPQLHFENITTAQGLSSNEINCFYQDKEGFLWIGTKYGLNRYDGKLFQSFYHDPANSNSLSGNNVVDILQDRDGIFWIATKDGGLTRYDPAQPKAHQFRQFSHNPTETTGIPTNRLNCLFDYNEQYLIVGSEVYSVLFIDKKTFAISQWATEKVVAPNVDVPFVPGPTRGMIQFKNWVHRIKAKGDTLYLSMLAPEVIYTVINGVIRFPVSYYPHEGRALTAPDFCLDGDTIWEANWMPGLFMQCKTADPELRDTFVQVGRFSSVDDVVTHVENFNSHFLILTTASKGVFIVDKTTGEKTSFTRSMGDSYSLLSNKCTALFRDRQGIWWIGTNAGISKYNPIQWQIHSLPIANDAGHDFTAFSVDEDDSGTIRVCTSDGIYKKSRAGKNFNLHILSDNGKIMQPTLIYKTGSAWILGTENSIFRYDPDRETIARLPLHGGADSAIVLYGYETFQVRSMLIDTVGGDPLLWFTPLGWGLAFYNFNKQSHRFLLNNDGDPKSIGNNLSRKVVIDKNKNLWVATSQGLYRWQRGNTTANDFVGYVNVPGEPGSISSSDITDLYISEDNHLWITTNGGGLNEFDGKKFIRYAPSLPTSNSMYGIYPDNSRRFWIPVPGGFEIFDEQTKSFRHLEVLNASYQLKLPSKIFTSKNGMFMYGAAQNLVYFYPDSIHFDDVFPKIYLRDFELFNESDRGNANESAFSYAHDENYFTVFYSALQLSQPATVHYQYRLDGLEENWSDGGTEGKVNYTNLPPGDYTFMARVTNPFGAWSETEGLISFTVRAPFWYCWWFYALCAAVIGGSAYLVSTFRVRQLLKIQNIRNRIANDLHDDVGSALSTITLYSEVAKMKSAEEEGLKEVLDKITTTSQEMQENMNFIVWSIQPRNDRLDHMVQQMKRYAIDMLQPRSIEVHFDIDEALHLVKLTPEKRRELFLIFKEAIHNITKYSNCSRVYIGFRKKGKGVILEITDDGVGFRKEEVVGGNGLYTMNDRARALNGKLQIRSAAEQGTTVELQFPI